MWKIDLKEGQQLFFTSDTHYNHSNICRGTSKWAGDLTRVTRNFQQLKEMNYNIVENINEMVGQDDILIHLGDWSFGGFESIQEFRERIICKNIYLVLGNHDNHIEDNKDNIRKLFVDVVHYTKLQVTTWKNKEMLPSKYVLCHFPIASWDGMNKGVIHLFGHVHLSGQKKVMRGKSMDVGVDGNFLSPYTRKDIQHFLEDNPCATNVIPSDHHETEIR